MRRRERPRAVRVGAAVLLPLTVVLILSALAWPEGGDPPRSRTHRVEIRGFEYHPKRLEVSVGDTVVWVNRDMVAHTATARDTAWDSGTIATDSTSHRVVRSKGRSSYICTYHPNMTGTLVVR